MMTRLKRERIITFSISMVMKEINFHLKKIVFFHNWFCIAGSRYISWLPNFSVEVTHVNNVFNATEQIQANNNLNINHMAEQVHQMFPHYSLASIRADLQTTFSMELTIDNILEERLLPPLQLRIPSDDEDDSFETMQPSTSNIVVGSTDSLGTSLQREAELRQRKENMLAMARRRWENQNRRVHLLIFGI